MAWLRLGAAQFREWLMQLAWLDGWQSSIAQTPDWALLAVGPAALLLLTLLMRITWPRSRTSRADTKPQAQKQSRQQASANVATAPATTKSPLTSAPARKLPAVAPVASRAPFQMADDDEDNRSVRVFVSSTFLDMQTERNELVTKTFPALRSKYRARGVELFEVDLRWGITREQQERGETLPTLLSEIDRCRPYFVGLLGDRYGWVPPSEALTTKLKVDYPVLAGAQGASVTAMEIMHGVFSNPDTAARSCFFERDRNWDWVATLSEADRAAATAEPEAVQRKLEDLKMQIRKKAHVEGYASPEEIGAKVTAAIDALLEASFPEKDAPDAFEQTARLHRAYARERRGLHVGADGYMRDLNRWMETKDTAPRLITGASGGGKSTLVANWLHAWRRAHPSDIVFEHYLGASPDSADPILIMRRLWEHLNRATDEAADPPAANAELMDVAAGLTQRLAQARAATARKGARFLIALDGLDKLSSEQNLRWLPIVPDVHVLGSSLEGEAKFAALARGFSPLEVKPLKEKERQEFVAGTLALWRRELEPQFIAGILQPAVGELAGSPLYLKTVLEELRVSADNAHLAERLEYYRSARDMEDLFDGVLNRLEDDCEPGFVLKALPLIWASRAGLEETEIIAITAASPLAWATLRNGLGDGLRNQQGRMAFGHDYLSQAVAARYLKTDEQKRAAHLSIADRFEARPPDVRQVEELPFQLRAAQAWSRLEAFLIDLDRFELLEARGDVELLSYWQPLRQQGRDLEALLCSAFEARAGEPARWHVRDAKLGLVLASFLEFAGAYGPMRGRLQERLVGACERLFGADDPNVSVSLNNLAGLLQSTNRLQEAEPLFRRALAIDEANFGPDHPNLAGALNNLADLFRITNRNSEAESLFRRALAIYEVSFGPNHANVARALNNLALLLRDTNRPGEAEPLFRRAIAINEANFGSDHPIVALNVGNLGLLLLATNRYQESESLFRRMLAINEAALGADHPRVATSLSNLGGLLCKTNRQGEAEPLYRRALAINEASFGPDHSDVASALDNLAGLLVATNRYSEAEPLYRRALAINEASLGPNHPDVARELNNLALLLEDTNRYSDAEPLYRRALTIDEASFGQDHPSVATVLNNLANLLCKTNRHGEAEPLYRRALAIKEASLGPENPDVASGLNNLAELLRVEGRYDEAEPLFRRALAIDEASFGPDHPAVARDLHNLAQLLRATNHHGEAEPLSRRALAINEASLGPEHPDVANGLNNLAELLRATGRYDEAEPLFRRALAIDEASFGPDHTNVATDLNNLAGLLGETNRHREAETLYRRALAISEASLGPSHPDVARGLNNLALLLADTNRYSDAEPLYRRALTIDEASFGADHPNVGIDLNNLALLLCMTGRRDQAESLYRRALAISEASYGPHHPSVATHLGNLAGLLEDTNRYEEAEPLYRRALAISEASFGPDHPSVATDLGNLALLLSSTNRHGEAEPLLRRALAIDEASFGPDHPSVAIDLKNLAGLLRATNRVSEAERLYRRAAAIG